MALHPSKAPWLLAALLFAAPAVPSAQTVDAPFADLKVKPGQTVIVTTQSGGRVRGRVEEVLPDALVLNITRGASVLRRIEPAEVREIHRPGHLWDGAVKGGLIGAGIAGLIGANFDYGGPAAVAGLLYGAGIGLGIDALFGPKRIYRVPQTAATLSVGPMMTLEGAGAAVKVTF